MKPLLSSAGETARCLAAQGTTLYVGWEALGATGHRLSLVDLTTQAELRSLKTPFVVGDLAIAEGKVHAALSPGHLLSWPGLDCAGTPEVRDADAKVLTVFEDLLYWGTPWGRLCALPRGTIARVKRQLCSVAVGDRHIYGGYSDGKVRVFDRTTGKPIAVLTHGGVHVSCLVVGKSLWTVDRGGELARWNTAVLREEARTRIASGQWSVTLRPGGEDRVVTFGEDQPVCVHASNGAVVSSWKPPVSRVEDVLVHDGQLLVAAGDTIHRGPVLPRVAVPAPEARRAAAQWATRPPPSSRPSRPSAPVPAAAPAPILQPPPPPPSAPGAA